ncbi:MAG TPA: ATP-binding protein [Vicinamibacteria bacterium]|nr:ATP-binding protein [Vicinamibacteria bacterium]
MKKPAGGNGSSRRRSVGSRRSPAIAGAPPPRRAKAGGGRHPGPRERSPGPPPEREELLADPDAGPIDLEALESLRRGRQSLGRTIRSSHEYWAGVHRVLQMRASLEQAEGRFCELYDFIPIPFLVLDRTLRVISVNNAAANLAGGNNGIALGQHLVALLDGRGYREVTALVSTGGPTRPIEAELRSREGWIPVQVVAQAVDHGPPQAAATRTHYIAIIDMSEVRRLETERRTLELERQRSLDAERLAREANQAKDEFLAMLSHELRTPLTPILAAASAIEPKGLPPFVGEAVEAIRRNVTAEARLIDDLLDMQRIRQRRLVVERRHLRFHELLQEVVEDWQPEAERRGLRVSVSFAANRDHVRVDAGRLAQVFRNLLSNAAKFTDAGGRIEVRTTSHEGRICASIQDSGAGMTPAQLRKLFEPFAGNASPWDPRAGLGLGLVISRGIVDAHGGRIHAHSGGPGLGTCIEVELDLLPASSADEDPVRAPDLSRSPAQPHLPGGRRGPSATLPEVSAQPPRARVLLVEDHADSAETLSMVLEMKGYTVTVASTLAEGRRQSGGCDVLISDISLPDGSGLDLMREVRRTRQVPGIALSGFGTEDDVRRSREAGFEEHLIKPVDVEHLLAAIARVGGEPRPN